MDVNQQGNLHSDPQKPHAPGRPKQQKRRLLKTAKVVRVYCVTFKLVKDPKDNFTYMLETDKICDLPNMERGEQNVGLLEQWKVEVRQRPTGVQDKLYFHPNSSKTLRSMVEICEFIQNNYDPSKSEQIRVRVSSERSSTRKVKKKDFQANKEIREPTIEGFLLHAEDNLRNSDRSSQSSCAESFKTITKVMENSALSSNSIEEESPEIINEMINELLDEENGLHADMTRDEVEVAKVLVDDMSKDVDSKAKVEPTQSFSENWIQRMLADFENV